MSLGPAVLAVPGMMVRKVLLMVLLMAYSDIVKSSNFEPLDVDSSAGHLPWRRRVGYCGAAAVCLHLVEDEM